MCSTAAWPLHGRDDNCCCRVGGGGLCAAGAAASATTTATVRMLTTMSCVTHGTLPAKNGGKVKPTAVQRASASSSPLNSALEKANLFGCSRDMRMRRRQRCLPNTQSIARALHGPRHIPSLLVADADVVQGCSNVGVTRRQNPSEKLQRALLHRQRIFMSTEGNVCSCQTGLLIIGRGRGSHRNTDVGV